MNPEVISAYFKWGHRKNRNRITILLSLIMVVTLVIQGIPLYYFLFSDNLQKEEKQQFESIREPPPLASKDFELMFGFNDRSNVRKEPREIPKTRLNLVLRGTLGHLDNSNQASSAIIQDSSQDKLYVVGEIIAGNVILKEVHADHVVLNRNGQLETLYFPDAEKDSRALQEYKKPVNAAENKANRPGFTQEPDGKSLEQRMQDLRDKLQNANQAI